MSWLEILSLVVVAFLAAVFGYQFGRQDGYDRGKVDAVIDCEKLIDQRAAAATTPTASGSLVMFVDRRHVKKIGDPCPTCGRALTRIPAAFYWRGRFRDGAGCTDCNSLFAIEGEEIAPLAPPVVP